MLSAPEPQPTSRSCPCPSKSRWERTTRWARSIIPPPPKGILPPYPGAPQEQRQQRPLRQSENTTPSAAIWNTAKDSTASTARQRQKGAYHIENRV